MTQTLGVDANNDLYIGGDGRLVVKTAIQAVLDNCAHAVKAMRGEMVLAVDSGMPNFQVLWVGAANIPQYESALRATITGVEGVQSIESLTIQARNNVLEYVATIKTIYGEGVING
jgi:hypothetical protein